MCLCRVKQRSREGLEAVRTELEEREKVGEELHTVQVWLQAARGLLSQMEQSGSPEELQVGGSHGERQWLCMYFMVWLCFILVVGEQYCRHTVHAAGSLRVTLC